MKEHLWKLIRTTRYHDTLKTLTEGSMTAMWTVALKLQQSLLWCYRFMVRTRIWSWVHLKPYDAYKTWRNCQAIDRLNNVSPSYQNVSTPWMKMLTDSNISLRTQKYRSAKQFHSNRYLDGKTYQTQISFNKALEQTKEPPSSQVLSSVWTWLKIDWTIDRNDQTTERMENNKMEEMKNLSQHVISHNTKTDWLKKKLM